MNIQKKLKLAKMLLKFSDLTTEEGVTITVDGDLEVGKEAFTTDENGELAPTPDGEYHYDNKIITIEGGIVKDIKEADVAQEEPVVEEPAVEEPMAEEPVVEEPVVEEPATDEKDEKIAELEARIAELEAENTELKAKIEEAEKPVEEPAEEKFNKEERNGAAKILAFLKENK